MQKKIHNLDAEFDENFIKYFVKKVNVSDWYKFYCRNVVKLTIEKVSVVTWVFVHWETIKFSQLSTFIQSLRY